MNFIRDSTLEPPRNKDDYTIIDIPNCPPHIQNFINNLVDVRNNLQFENTKLKDRIKDLEFQLSVQSTSVNI